MTPYTDGQMLFTCSTPDCEWEVWVPAAFDADGRAREVVLNGARPTCPVCGCRTIPDWQRGPRLTTGADNS